MEFHGGKEVNLLTSKNEVDSVLNSLDGKIAIQVPERITNHCEMIAIGAYSPLDGFMNKADALEVINGLKLTTGILWAIPILLPVPEDIFGKVKESSELVLI